MLAFAPVRDEQAGFWFGEDVSADQALEFCAHVLCARQLEKQHGWRPALAQALADRTDSPQPVTVALSVKAAAALDCLNIALDHWTASDGRLDLEDLLDEAFAAIGPVSR